MLATFYHPDVTIYEGGGINNGWADYRDHHLGPELKAFENLQFGHTNTKVTVLPGDQSAYATSEYSIKAKMGDRMLDSGGLETLVLVKSADGPGRFGILTRRVVPAGLQRRYPRDWQGTMQHNQHTGHGDQNHYLRLVGMIVLSFISMYVLMYSMANSFRRRVQQASTRCAWLG